MHGYQQSISITLPPLSVTYFKYIPKKEKAPKAEKVEEKVVKAKTTSKSKSNENIEIVETTAKEVKNETKAKSLKSDVKVTASKTEVKEKKTKVEVAKKPAPKNKKIIVADEAKSETPEIIEATLDAIVPKKDEAPKKVNKRQKK